MAARIGHALANPQRGEKASTRGSDSTKEKLNRELKVTKHTAALHHDANSVFSHSYAYVSGSAI